MFVLKKTNIHWNKVVGFFKYLLALKIQYQSDGTQLSLHICVLYNETTDKAYTI